MSGNSPTLASSAFVPRKRRASRPGRSQEGQTRSGESLVNSVPVSRLAAHLVLSPSVESGARESTLASVDTPAVGIADRPQLPGGNSAGESELFANERLLLDFGYSLESGPESGGETSASDTEPASVPVPGPAIPVSPETPERLDPERVDPDHLDPQLDEDELRELLPSRRETSPQERPPEEDSGSFDGFLESPTSPILDDAPSDSKQVQSPLDSPRPWQPGLAAPSRELAGACLEGARRHLVKGWARIRRRLEEDDDRELPPVVDHALTGTLLAGLIFLVVLF